MHPPIKTRLVGTLAGRGARPGEVRRAGAARRQPVGVHEHQTSGGARGRRGSHSRMIADFGVQPSLVKLGPTAVVLPLRL